MTNMTELQLLQNKFNLLQKLVTDFINDHSPVNEYELQSWEVRQYKEDFKKLEQEFQKETK